jgi:hypothetical protein
MVIAMIAAMVIAMIVAMVIAMIVAMVIAMVRTLIVVSRIFAVGHLSPGNWHRANRSASQNSDSKEFFHVRPKL